MAARLTRRRARVLAQSHLDELRRLPLDVLTGRYVPNAVPPSIEASTDGRGGAQYQRTTQVLAAGGQLRIIVMVSPPLESEEHIGDAPLLSRDGLRLAASNGLRWLLPVSKSAVLDP